MKPRFVVDWPTCYLIVMKGIWYYTQLESILRRPRVGGVDDALHAGERGDGDGDDDERWMEAETR